MQEIKKKKLFTASCLALLVTALSFGIRAGIMGQLAVEYKFNASQLGSITATAFWGFPLAIIIGGFIVDVVGMKRLLITAFIFHLAGIGLTVFAVGYWSLFFSTLLIGIANGTVEASCNPLVASLYTDNKTTKLNHFHLWFPGGIVIGTLLAAAFQYLGLNWQFQVGMMVLPTLLYGYLFLKLDFPKTERVSSGFSTLDMYRAVASPLFIFMFICMFGTAITELFTGQWIGMLLKNITENPILLLTLTTGIMVIGRAFAGPIVKRFSPQGVLLISSVIAALGLYMLSSFTGTSLFLAAVVFGLGVCYFWPTMIGFVAENIPRSGALGLNLMGGAGMFAVSVYTMFMGGFYDRLILNHLPSGIDLDVYLNVPEGSEDWRRLAEAKNLAGPEILQTTLIIPLLLILAFSGLFLSIRSKKIRELQQSQIHA
ncbi:MFS family permease [Flavobacterium sp. W4I14]|nr:MFS family permease [Flavobacterium sp. W4I14]